MKGILEFKIIDGKLHHNIIEIEKQNINYNYLRNLIGDTYDIVYYNVLVRKNIIIIVDDNGYAKNLLTTFILGKQASNSIIIYRDSELKGNIYMLKRNSKFLNDFEYDILNENDIEVNDFIELTDSMLDDIL